MKSAYKMLQAQNGSGGRQQNDEIWRTLWSIKAPPKALNLVWRALALCLPTIVQLYRKHVFVHTHCQVCAVNDETIFHALVGYHIVVQCWKTWDLGIYINEEVEFSIWLEDVLKGKNKHQRAEVITLYWSIWRARNELIWNKQASMVNRIVAGAK